jgi:hypothetical protein
MAFKFPPSSLQSCRQFWKLIDAKRLSPELAVNAQRFEQNIDVRSRPSTEPHFGEDMTEILAPVQEHLANDPMKPENV